MTPLLLENARVVTPHGVVEPGWVRVEEGRIVAIGGADTLRSAQGGTDGSAPEVVDAGRRWLLPGLVDVHVHGALGHETMDGDVAGLQEMARFYAAHGVTSFLATTWTGSTDDTIAALHGVARAMAEPDARGAQLLGAHLEGPYLNPDRCGAQDVSVIRRGTLDESMRFLDTGVVRMMTIAPEMPGHLEVVRGLVEHGVVMSAGHTDATYDQMRDAVAAGVTHVTHTFNAMRPLHHREPGAVGAAMALPELSVELIADDIHVHPAAMRALYATRGAEGIVLVTDAISAAGMPSGEYPIGDRTVIVADGAVRLPDGALAGSMLTLDVGLRNLQRATGRSLAELWPTSSRNAARIAGVGDHKGTIEVGRDADLVVVDDQVRVELTIVGGRLAHRADEELEIP
jgi:N-acetylglucosamine-6-phosphate deacetylase